MRRCRRRLARFLAVTTVNRSPAWGLLPWNVGRLHQLEIGGDVVLEELVEFRNGHRQLLDTDLRQPLLHRRQCECVYDLVVQLVEDGAWRPRWQVRSGIERIDHRKAPNPS